jgi:hypothetical protein
MMRGSGGAVSGLGGRGRSLVWVGGSVRADVAFLDGAHVVTGGRMNARRGLRRSDSGLRHTAYAV